MVIGKSLLPAWLLGLCPKAQHYHLINIDNLQDLGYPLELGYQNFLYPSEPDLRDLLLFLAERLPTDTSEDADQPAGERECSWGDRDREVVRRLQVRGGSVFRTCMVDWGLGGRCRAGGTGPGAELTPRLPSTLLSLPPLLPHGLPRYVCVFGLFIPRSSYMPLLGPMGLLLGCQLREGFLRLLMEHSSLLSDLLSCIT